MDTQDRLVAAITKLSDTVNQNHLEVCQRLTAVETSLDTFAPLPERVARLEGWRSKVIGFTVAANMVWAGVLAWARHK